MNENGIADIIREQMFLVSLKACNNLFSLNKKHTKSTQQDINDNQLQQINKKQFCRSLRGLKRLLLFYDCCGFQGRALRAEGCLEQQGTQ